MGFHHLALAVKHMQHTHEFYEKAMGFDLIHVERAMTPDGEANHFFYETGGEGLMAFWELKNPDLAGKFRTGLSQSAGLPDWVNHLAFDCGSDTKLKEISNRWLGLGMPVIEVDHHWCKSIYQLDPDGNFVEFCYSTMPLGEDQRIRAQRAIAGEELPLDPSPGVDIHMPTEPFKMSFTPRQPRQTVAEVLEAMG